MKQTGRRLSRLALAAAVGSALALLAVTAGCSKNSDDGPPSGATGGGTGAGGGPTTTATPYPGMESAKLVVPGTKKADGK